jgi:hypothetical protein
MKSLLNKIRKSYLLIAAGILILANVFTFAPAVFALTYLVKPQVVETNMDASAASSLIITFTTSASNTGTTLSVTFPAGYTVAASQTYNTVFGTPNCTAITGATSDLPTAGTITAAGSGQTITFSGISALVASHSYCGVLTGSAITTNPSAGVYAGTITAGTDAAAPIAWDVISTDQVVVTAVIPASFTLSLSSNTDAFTANLATGSIRTTTGVTATMTTNGTGWVLYGSDVGSELTSPSTGHHILSTSIDANTTITAGAENYVTGLTSSGTVVPAFVGGVLGKGGGLSGSVVQLASGTGPTASATAVATEYATISGTTPAASDYTDTITLLGAGTF